MRLHCSSQAPRLRIRFSTAYKQRRFYTPTLPKLPIFAAIEAHKSSSTAIVHSRDRLTFTYGSLINDVAHAKDALHKRGGQDGLKKGTRIGLMSESSYDYVVSMLSIWAAGGIFVPLCTTHPKPEIEYVVNDAGCELLLVQDRYQDLLEGVGKDMLTLGESFQTRHNEPQGSIEFTDGQVVEDDNAMILYTSGTTSKPKGVLSGHSNIQAQCDSLLKAWQYSSKDYLLHVLPLHHIHGIVNALTTPLFAGSTVEFQKGFNASKVWNRLVVGHSGKRNAQHENEITMFMGVPTIYKALASHFETLPPGIQPTAAESASSLRLAVCGSAALPVRLANSWTAITGTPLLERYGMTEIGMALSCGLPVETRLLGSVGKPLPGVECRLVDEDGKTIKGSNKEGELQVCGMTVFKEYWQKPDVTASEFVKNETDGKSWFKTGDIAMRGVDGEYYIRGRNSVDIIKVGGEKVSALEIERDILEMPNISEVSVVALPSNYWGQIVAAVIVLSPGTPTEWFKKAKARKELKKRIAVQKIPRIWRVVESIPRNAMGKVNKKELVEQVFKDYKHGEEEAEEKED